MLSYFTFANLMIVILGVCAIVLILAYLSGWLFEEGKKQHRDMDIPGDDWGFFDEDI